MRRTVKRRTEEEDEDSMGRRRSEKVLYRDEVDEDCEEKDCGR